MTITNLACKGKGNQDTLIQFYNNVLSGDVYQVYMFVLYDTS